MFGSDFYPTPRDIIIKMVAPYGDIDTRSVLEPSDYRYEDQGAYQGNDMLQIAA